MWDGAIERVRVQLIGSLASAHFELCLGGFRLFRYDHHRRMPITLSDCDSGLGVLRILSVSRYSHTDHGEMVPCHGMCSVERSLQEAEWRFKCMGDWYTGSLEITASRYLLVLRHASRS